MFVYYFFCYLENLKNRLKKFDFLIDFIFVIINILFKVCIFRLVMFFKISLRFNKKLFVTVI